MAYTKNTWQTGDVVTSAKLNHMEDGIAAGGGVLIVHDVDGTLDKTWQEIADAGFAVLAIEVNAGAQTILQPLIMFMSSGGTYTVYFYDFAEGTPLHYETQSSDGYPETEK